MNNLTGIIAYFLNHSLVQSSFIVFAGSMLANFGAYLYHLLIGRILGPQYYGELAALLSIFNILNVPSTTLQTILVKYFSELKAKKRFDEIKWLLLFATRGVFILEFLSFILIIPFLSRIASFLQIGHSEYFIWVYLVFASFLISTINGSVLQALQLFKESTIIVNLGMLLRVVLGVIFAYFGVGWVLISNIFSNSLSYLFSFYPIRFIFRLKSQRFNLSRRHLLAYSIPTFITGLGITSLYSQDVILVKHYFNPETAGIYSSLSVLGRIIFFATTAISFVIFPVIAEYKENQKSYQRLALIALAAVSFVSFGITLLYFLWPKLFVDLLFGRAFLGAVPYMGPFGVFISFFSLSSLIVTMCLAAGRTLVWIFVSIAAVSQIALISFFHNSLYTITLNNILVSGSLFAALLLYFVYAQR